MRKNSDSSDSQSNFFGFRLRPAKPFSSGSLSSATTSPDGRQNPENYDSLLESYRREEDEFLRELDDLRQSSLSRNSSRNATELLPESPCQSRNFVGSFCQLLTYVVQVRRENQRLKQQIFCLSEMREIDAMRTDLILKNSEATVTPRLSPVEFYCQTDVIGEKNSTESSPLPTDSFVSRNSLLPTSSYGVATRRKAERNSEETAIESGKNPVEVSPSEAQLHSDNSEMIRRSTRTTRRSAPYTDDSNFPSKSSQKSPTESRSCGVDTNSAWVQQGGGEALCDSSLPVEKPSELLKTPIVSITRNSDSDDQPVFSEVDLPDYQSKLVKLRTSRGTSVASSPTSPVSPYCTVALFEPPNSDFHSNSTLNDPGQMINSISSDKPDGKSNRFWNRFSVRSNRKPPEKQENFDPDEFVYTVQPGSKYGGKKAFLKKRKRKISESDSLASSEASGKPYKTIDLPELESEY